eukprot:3828762-Prymnesium_polylepis.1
MARRLGFCFGRMQPQTQTQHPVATAGDAAAAQPAGAVALLTTRRQLRQLRPSVLVVDLRRS